MIIYLGEKGSPSQKKQIMKKLTWRVQARGHAEIVSLVPDC